MSRADSGTLPALPSIRPSSTPNDARSITVKRCIVGPLLLALQFAVPFANAATVVPTVNAPLRVVTTPIAPFVLPGTDPLAGFSIDVWDAVARRMHVDFTLQVVAADERFSKVQGGETDVAIGLLVMLGAWLGAHCRDMRAEQPVATENRRLTRPTGSPTLRLA